MRESNEILSDPLASMDLDIHLMERTDQLFSEAVVKIRVGDEVMLTAAEGNGPVNALDDAVRKALLPYYPTLEAVHLVDYKVRILDGDAGTSAKTCVLIDSSNGDLFWSTVGSSPNIIEASWQALADSLEYALLKSERVQNPAPSLKQTVSSPV